MAFKKNDAFEHTLFGFCDIGQKINSRDSHLLNGSDDLQRQEGTGKPSETKMTLNEEVTEKYERKAQGLLVSWLVLCQEMLSIFNF